MAEDGLIIVLTGNGKGKTTAALGMLVRALGQGMKVAMLQFIKSPATPCGEHIAAKQIGLEIVAGGAGRGKGAALNKTMALDLWDKAKQKIASDNYDMVALDELTYPMKYGWLPVGEVVEFLKNRPKGVHVVITGRAAPPELIGFADMATEMREVRHPFQKGIRARRGVEF